MPKKNLPDINTVIADFPDINFVENEEFYWSAKTKTVFYNKGELVEKNGIYRLLHEIGHALSGHKNYTSGIQLLKFETQAWKEACEIAKNYGLVINNEQIENCLDSYRDWLHLRSTCPQCKTVAIEANSNQYHCFNCFQKWKVPSDQRARHYRLKLVKAT